MAAIEEAKGVQAELIKGGGGIFDVKLDGQLIFSKHEQGRFPDNEEVIELIP